MQTILVKYDGSRKKPNRLMLKLLAEKLTSDIRV